MEILSYLKHLKETGKKGFAVLIDPDDTDAEHVIALANRCNDARVDLVLFGGSLMLSSHMDKCIQAFKSASNIPVVLFPGSPAQISRHADALLLLSLVSGRNPDLLIGQHVLAAPAIKASGLEVIATAYMLIDGGVPTTVSYMSHSAPIPRNKPDIALSTAWAAELMGQQILYMDAGSGAQFPISENMIKKVSNNVQLPLIIGGGIRDVAGVRKAFEAGAQVVVVGNAIEKNPELIEEMSAVSKSVFINV